MAKHYGFWTGLVLACGVALPTLAQDEAAPTADTVVATVNGTEITLGELIDCDFTQATLDLCRFYSVDISRQTFAPWPQFVVPYDRELAASKLDRTWPGEFKRYLALAQDEHPKLSASTGTVDYFCHNKKKNRGFGLTEAELRQALLDVGGVVM